MSLTSLTHVSHMSHTSHTSHMTLCTNHTNAHVPTRSNLKTNIRKDGIGERFHPLNVPGIIRREYSIVKLVRWRYALENLHVGGRGLVGDEVHAANEIFVSEQYKLIYVVSRKCTSSAISLFLENHLNAGTHLCDPHRCPLILNDCTPICLNSRDLLDHHYLVFSFVHHPVRRGFKSMTTILSRSTLESDYVHAAALQILTLLSLSRVGPSLGNLDLCA